MNLNPFTSGHEDWKVVPGFDRYEVSSLGRVRRRNRERAGRAPYRLLRPFKSGIGYRRIELVRSDGEVESAAVHRLVLLAFVGPPPLGATCRHLNDALDDNRLENLQWDTQQRSRDRCSDLYESRSIPELLDKWTIPIPFSGCLIWMRRLNDCGYGIVQRHGKKVLVHRLSLEQKLGRALTECALHTCDVRACVNPDHLYEGTPADNAADRVRRLGREAGA